MGFISNLLNPAKMVEGAVGSLLGGGSSGSDPFSMIESLFSGDSIGGSSGSGDSSSGASGLMSVVSLAAMFV